MSDDNGIYKRLIDIYNSENDTSLAKSLNISRQALSNFKVSGRWPKARLKTVCAENGINESWLLSGNGVKYEKDLERENDAKLELVIDNLKNNTPLLNMIYGFIVGDFAQRTQYRVHTDGKDPDTVQYSKIETNTIQRKNIK